MKASGAGAAGADAAAARLRERGAQAALEGGAIAVADFTYRVAVAPSTMDVNREQRLVAAALDGLGQRRARAAAATCGR